MKFYNILIKKSTKLVCKLESKLETPPISIIFWTESPDLMVSRLNNELKKKINKK